MVPAYVEKRFQNPVLGSNHDDRLAGYVSRDELSRLNKLVGSSHELPASRENLPTLQFIDPGVGVPFAGNCGSLFQRRGHVVVPQ